MTTQRDMRKSNFAAVESSESTDYFDLVRNGQNLRISQSNLISDFGTTGSISAVGEDTAIPVLNQVGTENQIRGLIGGSGITTSLSALGGISIKHNFTVDTGGVPIMLNESALSPTLVSLEAGAGISVGASGNSIQIALTDTPPSTKTVIVYEEDDFPTAIGDLITLEADTFYQIVADISTANRLLMQEGTILAGADYITTLSYTGTGIFINATDVNSKLTNITIATNGGTIFGLSSDGTHFFRAFLCNFSGANIGNIHNYAVVLINNSNFTSITTQGMTLSGAFQIFIANTVGFTIPSGAGVALDLGTATFDYFLVDKGLLDVNGTGYVLSGLATSGNINVGGLGTILNSINFGTATFSDNITPFDSRWETQMNPNLPNSVDILLATHSGATITIASSSTPVIIDDTWTAVTAYRFTATAGGRFTYTGKGSHVSMTATITADLASGIDDLSFFIYINGVQVAASRVQREFNSGDPGNLSLIWESLLETDDYIELWVQNDDTNVDVDIVNCTLRLKGA